MRSTLWPVVTFDRRSHNPILREAALDRDSPPIPWLRNYRVEFAYRGWNQKGSRVLVTLKAGQDQAEKIEVRHKGKKKAKKS